MKRSNFLMRNDVQRTSLNKYYVFFIVQVTGLFQFEYIQCGTQQIIHRIIRSTKFALKRSSGSKWFCHWKELFCRPHLFPTNSFPRCYKVSHTRVTCNQTYSSDNNNNSNNNQLHSLWTSVTKHKSYSKIWSHGHFERR